jgi:hypothetical protein
MATKLKRQLVIAPGKEVLQDFMKINGQIFNVSEIERMCELPNGSFRHIRAGSRILHETQYKQIQAILLPKLCELVYILQNYREASYREQHVLSIEY